MVKVRAYTKSVNGKRVRVVQHRRSAHLGSHGRSLSSDLPSRPRTKVPAWIRAFNNDSNETQLFVKENGDKIWVYPDKSGSWGVKHRGSESWEKTDMRREQAIRFALSYMKKHGGIQ